MVKRKFDDEEEFETIAQPALKRVAIRTTGFSTQGQIDVAMDEMPMVETPNSDHAPIFPGAYPPSSQTLYPFPMKHDDMDCDESPSSPDSSIGSHLSKSSTDPIHGRVIENRYPSNASSISTQLQPRTRNESCACPRIPKLVLAQYTNEEGKRTMWSHCEGCGAMDMVMGCDGQPVTC
jgi:hypothetical protein